MNIMKRIAIIFLVYIGIVVAFESLIGYFQPANQSTLVITTHSKDGAPHERVLARLENDGQLYVAANHWPRSWYRQALEDPNVEVILDGVQSTYRAVPVRGEEHDRIEADNVLEFPFRVLTGFPPRHFLRLDPRK